MRRSLWLLLTVLLAVGGLAGCSSPGTVVQETSPRVRRRAHKKAQTAPTLSTLSLDNLYPTRESKKGPSRNLFAFEQDPAVLAARKAAAAKAAALREKLAKKTAKELTRQQKVRAQHPPKPQPPTITFHFVGYFGLPQKKIGVFTTSDNKNVLLAQKGDTILSRFHILDIGYESAEIGFKHFKETKRIPLSGGGSIR